MASRLSPASPAPSAHRSQANRGMCTCTNEGTSVGAMAACQVPSPIRAMQVASSPGQQAEDR